MAISVSAQLNDAERVQISQILGCDPKSLDKTLQPFAAAGLEEYLRMILGQRVFTRGSDILEHRLLLLTKAAFNGRIPDEQRVSALFQLSSTGSRSLIRAVLAKYQYELRDEIDATMRDALESVDEDEHGWTFTVNSENVVETMNRILAVIDGTLPQVSKKPTTVSTYNLRPSSYGKLCSHFGVTPKQSKQSSQQA